MYEPNFAPAPYTTLEIGSHAGFHQYIVDANGRKIGVAWGPHDQKVWTAALWAVSPKLLETLRLILSESYEHELEPRHSVSSKAIEAARAIIAELEGRA